MKIGIYGGTFNPPHLGHLSSAAQAVEKLGLDKLLLVPTGTPPHKELPPGSPTARQRYEMTALAADGLGLGERVRSDDIELGREGRSFTADTLRLLGERYPEDELWLLMGSDMFLSLQNWYHPDEICALARLAVFSRHEARDLPQLQAQAGHLEETFGAKTTLLTLERMVEVSSTALREALSRGERPNQLPDAVYGYILRNGLYGARADLKHLTDDELRCCSLSMVYAKRHRHIRGVEEEAVRLARRWGADEQDARHAGILHDCTKYLSLDEHLALCEKYHVPLDEMERVSDKLLHSKTGAALARYLYGQNEQVCRAIYWHTTGRPDMTLLEKILYLADYMEPNRDFDGVEELRRLCYEDLDAALTLAFTMSVEDLKERGKDIHPNTQGALDWMLTHGKGQ